MPTNYDKILEESFEWIRNTPRASTAEVPEYLNIAWTVPHETDDEPTGFHMKVFAFGYMQCRLLESPRSRSNPHRIAMSQMQKFFLMWQMKLAMGELSRLSDLKSAPMHLWQFRPNEKVKFWHDKERN